ncbi:MAG: hypothetical protein AAF696_13465 [Bacteroidota bacterium]
MRRIHFFIICIHSIGFSGLWAQELTLSPYSRFALGDILSGATTRNAAMGGIGVASDNYFSVNPINPASYGDMYFTTLDFGGFWQASRLETPTSEGNQRTAGFQNVGFAFPSNDNFVFAAGFSPYSAVGYNVTTFNTLQVEDSSLIERTDYSSAGGLNKVYFGTAIRLLNSRLRLGVNFQYSFGNTQYDWRKDIFAQDSVTRLPDFRSVQIIEDAFLSGWLTQIGAIYVDTLNASNLTMLRLGAVLDYNLNLDGDRFTAFSNGIAADTINNIEEGNADIPTKLAFGVMLTQLSKYSLGFDVSFQNWEDFRYFSDDTRLGREIRLALGGEFTPNYRSLKYFKRVNYRAGAYWRQTYINVGGEAVQDFGFTVGLGIPAGLKGGRPSQGRSVSRFNISAELGRRGSLDGNQQLSELYARIRFGVNLNDRWFVRRVVD